MFNTEGDVSADRALELVDVRTVNSVVDNGTQRRVLQAEEVVGDLADAEVLVRLRRDEDGVLTGRVEL